MVIRNNAVTKTYVIRWHVYITVIGLNSTQWHDILGNQNIWVFAHLVSELWNKAENGKHKQKQLLNQCAKTDSKAAHLWLNLTNFASSSSMHEYFLSCLKLANPSILSVLWIEWWSNVAYLSNFSWSVNVPIFNKEKGLASNVNLWQTPGCTQ